MRALIKTIALLFVITSFNTAKADILFDIDEAMVSKNWIKADRLLQKLSNKYNNPAITFKVLASRSWVAAKQGNWRKARKLVNSARNSAVSKDQEDIAALNDTDLAIRLSNVKGLPSLHERIVIGGAKDRFGAKIKKSGKDVYKVINTEVSSLLKGFMAVEKAMVPFSVPVPPKLEKGEFEKTNDFLNRVGIAEKKYKKRIDIIKKDFQSRIDKKQKEIEIKGKQLPEMRRFYTQWIMNAAFGQPKITRLKYDADLEVFRAQVVVKNGFGEVLKHNVAIDVPIEKAKHTKSELLSANPMLVYKISDQGLLMTHVFIHSPSNSLYTAELSKDAGKRKESYQVATIDVADMMGQTTVAMASMAANLGSSVTSVSIDPEIKKLKEKINKAKIDNLEKARKKRYIAKLQKELEKYTATTKKQYFDDLESLIATRKKTLVNPKKYAVVIGIEKYASTAEVAFANRSAKAFSSLAEKILGVPKDNIYTLTDSQATAGNISVRIKDFAARVPRGGTLYFYYAGHGIPAQVKGKTGLPYILPYDISPQFIHLEDRFMLSNIWKQLSYNNRGKVVAFMDSCFSGNADNNLVFEGVAPGLMRRVDATLPNNKILIYTAGNSHQFANYYPEKGHRLFSYYLFKGLMEGRQKTALGLQDYIQTNVSKQSRKMGPAYEQTPEIKGNTKEGIL